MLILTEILGLDKEDRVKMEVVYLGNNDYKVIKRMSVCTDTPLMHYQSKVYDSSTDEGIRGLLNEVNFLEKNFDRVLRTYE